MIYDVAIIGGGSVGACIARELSKYKGHFCIIEKADDQRLTNAGNEAPYLPWLK